MLPSGLSPSNLHLRSSVKMTFVESDVFDVCHRLAAVSPDLHLWQMEEDGYDGTAWVVTEATPRGEELVKKFMELDARVIEDVEKMRRIPLEHRVAAAQAEIDAAEASQKQDTLDMLYETVGQKMHRQLEKDGFIQRPTSYHKSYVKQRAGR